MGKRTLSTWKQKYLKNQKQVFSGDKEPDEFSEELKALKKELRIAREERDILKSSGKVQGTKFRGHDT